MAKPYHIILLSLLFLISNLNRSSSSPVPNDVSPPLYGIACTVCSSCDNPCPSLPAPPPPIFSPPPPSPTISPPPPSPPLNPVNYYSPPPPPQQPTAPNTYVYPSPPPPGTTTGAYYPPPGTTTGAYYPPPNGYHYHAPPPPTWPFYPYYYVPRRSHSVRFRPSPSILLFFLLFL